MEFITNIGHDFYSSKIFVWGKFFAYDSNWIRKECTLNRKEFRIEEVERPKCLHNSHS